jgi:mRNA interferase RelE/StbE
MDVTFKKISIKDINNLPSNVKESINNILFIQLLSYNNIKDIPNLVKIKGFTQFYRIKEGNYRIGLKIENNKIIIY